MKSGNLVVFCVLLLIGCKKDKTPSIPVPPETYIYDTVFPCEYLPAYPGSYWTYENDSGQVHTDSAVGYQLHALNVEYLNQGAQPDYKYYPIYKNRVLNKYRLRQINLPNVATYYQVLLPDPILNGSAFVCNTVWPGYVYHGHVIAVDSVINIGGVSFGNVVVINETEANGGFLIGRTYYAKDVGLIKYERISYYTGEVVETTSLIDYFINQ